MTHPAFAVKELSDLLLHDHELMRRWKAASASGQIEAVSVEGQNFAVVRDQALVEFMREHHGQIRAYLFDESTRTVR